MKFKVLFLAGLVFLIILGIPSIAISAKNSYNEVQHTRMNDDGYGKPDKVIVDNATVSSSDRAVRLSGTINDKPISVTLQDYHYKLPVVMKKTGEAIVYRYKGYQKNTYAYYAETQGTLKDYRKWLSIS